MDEPSQVKDFRRGCTQIHADAVGVDRLSGVIIGCAFRVMNGLCAGFAEKVYENSLAHELRKAGPGNRVNGLIARGALFIPLSWPA